jgi:tetratricopeptide (TPR) repeat protein
MLSANPLLGVGGGNYPVLMRRYVPPSAIDPKVLAFLRNDLPLFNDYLQALVEVGIVGGALFFVFFLVTPVCLAIRNADNRTPSGVVASLSLFSCIGLALAGMLDYPLLRPETLFLFGLLLGAAVGERHQTHEELEKNGSGNARQLSAFLLIAGGVSLAGTAFVYTTSFALRMNVISERSIEALRVSWRAWPWDGQWNERYAVRLYEAGRYEEVTEYLDSRAELWPDDPATYLARAETALMRHEYEVAMQSYERALFEVPGGRCSWRARSYLERAANVRDLSLNLKQRALELLARCS